MKQSVLGRQVAYPEHYSPEILVRVDRAENRLAHAIDIARLPFVGFDVWNAYEVSILTENGIPANFVLRMLYPCESPYIVESKSLKLYLNAFNKSRFGRSVDEIVSFLTATVSHDLSSLLEIPVKVVLETPPTAAGHTVLSPGMACEPPVEWPCWGMADLSFVPLTAYKEDRSLLLGDFGKGGTLMGMTDMLRSRCKVTSQPDWGDLYLYMQGERLPSVDKLLRYIVSFRDENHFHEEVVEMIYAALWSLFTPEELLVMAFYTRRGGIDINPVRASRPELITRFAPHVSGFGHISVKSPRQ
ncbi:MAG: NADPH-dependent 7-cyano-7-deazaguanine reductase QueF [Porphyromonadaceae bacterium]|nr:NADPH-dependent 7-cyano-7-deazaguanine reductase QueF [Porphyromonadaceae bacterium]